MGIKTTGVTFNVNIDESNSELELFRSEFPGYYGAIPTSSHSFDIIGDQIVIRSKYDQVDRTLLETGSVDITPSSQEPTDSYDF